MVWSSPLWPCFDWAVWVKKLEWPISLHVDKLLELYIVDQLSEAEVNGAPHPRVHPSSPHAPEDRRVVVRVVPGQAK